MHMCAHIGKIGTGLTMAMIFQDLTNLGNMVLRAILPCELSNCQVGVLPHHCHDLLEFRT